jgi:hypothetical protein
MDGSFDSTLGSDPVHQDRPHQWARLADLTRFLVPKPRMIIAPDEGRRIAINRLASIKMQTYPTAGASPPRSPLRSPNTDLGLCQLGRCLFVTRTNAKMRSASSARTICSDAIRNRALATSGSRVTSARRVSAVACSRRHSGLSDTNRKPQTIPDPPTA